MKQQVIISGADYAAQAAEIERMQDENGILRREVISVSLANERICAERDEARKEIARVRDLIANLDTPYKLRRMTRWFKLANARKRYYRRRVWFAEHDAERLRAKLDGAK